MTVEYIREVIVELESINPADELAYEKILLIFSRIERVLLIRFQINFPIEVFRARPESDNIFFTDISDFSLAPNKKVSGYGRCNRPYQSIFYCAENRPTSYFELVNSIAANREVGDRAYITIGKWHINPPFETLIVTSSNPEHRISEFDRQHGPAFDQMLNGIDPEQKEAVLLFYDYLYGKFRSSTNGEDHTYLITSAYCNLAMSLVPHIDAIYYPSVPFEENGVNFAFKKSFVQSHFIELTGASRQEVEVYLSDNGAKSIREVNRIEAMEVDLPSGTIYWPDLAS